MTATCRTARLSRDRDSSAESAALLHLDREMFVYHMIIKKRITSVFERLNDGDYEHALSGIGTTFEHRFAGEHCLGGKRTSTETLSHWFERLFRLFPIFG